MSSQDWRTSVRGGRAIFYHSPSEETPSCTEAVLVCNNPFIPGLYASSLLGQERSTLDLMRRAAMSVVRADSGSLANPHVMFAVWHANCSIEQILQSVVPTFQINRRNNCEGAFDALYDVAREYVYAYGRLRSMQDIALVYLTDGNNGIEHIQVAKERVLEEALIGVLEALLLKKAKD